MAIAMISRLQHASHPPAGLYGWDSDWSRLVSATAADGRTHTWHVLDNGVVDPIGTMLCVHGNPTWSYMWRGLASASTRWRVVAVDALNMGFSDRTGDNRELAGHITDLGAVTAALGIEGPVVTVAHDWGGPISLGWAIAHPDQLAGIVLLNTGVARPDDMRIPPLIQAVRTRATLRASCVSSPMFLKGALGLAHPSLPKEVRQAYAAPYPSPASRVGIGDFVADIPFDSEHPTYATLDTVGGGLHRFAETPSLLLWGARDPVFSTAFLADLRKRLPHAAVHRYAKAGHLVMEDIGGEAVILDWLETVTAPTLPLAIPGSPGERTGATTDDGRRLWSAVAARKNDHAVAVAEMAPDGSAEVSRALSFADLAQRVEALRRRLIAAGVEPGDRVAPLIPPGIDLVVVVYACWQAGAVVVAADAALGVRGIANALRAARPDHVIADWRGLALARGLNLSGKALSLKTLPGALRRTLGVEASLAEPGEAGRPGASEFQPGPDDLAAVVFTSGSTGPSKAVAYRHRQLEAQRDALMATYSLSSDDRMVAAFAPFAIFGPALGITSVVPAMDVSAPASLDARAFANAAQAMQATIAFASPAALANVVATADGLDDHQRAATAQLRAVASAGAPISKEALRAMRPHFVNAQIHTPYGMTEVMPVTNISLEEIEAAGAGNGVCVGVPISGVELAVSAISGSGQSTWDFIQRAGVTGEICVRAAHTSDGYDALWATQNQARRGAWHRTGDVGHIDTAGRLWVEGRMSHLILSAHGPLTPVGIEHQAESVNGVRQAAAVGVGPVGTQQLVLVVSTTEPTTEVVADEQLSEAVRMAIPHDVAAVLTTRELPVDRRHNSKIERQRIAAWAESVLAGGRVPRL
jgi:acyl-CoA synthetase (AMP-forming)/AMP-acid ligase II/pimeloyl-ACP methyl ester carboxylesterase